MTDPVSRRERQRHLDQARIDTFVVRARRIEAHSLAQDPVRLSKLAAGPIRVTFKKDSEPTISFDHPPEEQVESAAARVRPLLLDDVAMLSVLKAITSLTADTDARDQVRTWARLSRETWKRRVGETHSGAGFIGLFESTATGETNETNDIELALAWIYGDVVHHDPEHLERTRLWGVGERFRAAVPLVAFVMIAAIKLLNSIRRMEQDGLLHVSAEAWAVDVVAEAKYEHTAEVYISELGAPAPQTASEPMGDAWARLNSPGLVDNGPPHRTRDQLAVGTQPP